MIYERSYVRLPLEYSGTSVNWRGLVCKQINNPDSFCDVASPLDIDLVDWEDAIGCIHRIYPDFQSGTNGGCNV